MHWVPVFSCSLSIRVANCYIKQGFSTDLLDHQLFRIWKDASERCLTSGLFFLFPRVMIIRRAASVKLVYFA